MSAMVSRITNLTIVCSTFYSCADQSSTSLAFVWGIHQWPVNSPHKGPVMCKIFPFGDVIMQWKMYLTLKSNFKSSQIYEPLSVFGMVFGFQPWEALRCKCHLSSTIARSNNLPHSGRVWRPTSAFIFHYISKIVATPHVKHEFQLNFGKLAKLDAHHIGHQKNDCQSWWQPLTRCPDSMPMSTPGTLMTSAQS